MPSIGKKVSQRKKGKRISKWEECKEYGIKKKKKKNEREELKADDDQFK